MLKGNKHTKKHFFYLLLTAYYLLLFAGCATALYVRPAPMPGVPGIYHRVETGQTLWRISKIYNIDLAELVRINHILDAASIEVGQQIFIPNRQKPEQPTYKYSSLEDFIWPLKGKVISSFGQTFNNMINKGINIEPYRIPDIVAARRGKIVFYADDFEGFGKTIIIDHGDGFLTVYARNAQVFIKVGDNVEKGTRIAKVGSAGRDKNKYLHFEIRKGYIPQNPYFYLSH